MKRKINFNEVAVLNCPHVIIFKWILLITRFVLPFLENGACCNSSIDKRVLNVALVYN